MEKALCLRQPWRWSTVRDWKANLKLWFSLEEGQISLQLYSKQLFSANVQYAIGLLILAGQAKRFNSTVSHSREWKREINTRRYFSRPSINCGMENFTGNSSFYSASSSVSQFSEKPTGSIPLACLYSVISFIAVFGNLLVITAVIWDHTLRSYTSNYFLANLAVADFFQGAVAIPLRILEVMALEYDPNVFCRVAIPTAILFGSSSNLAILVISIDRFLAVQYPYIYVRYSTLKFIFGAIACSWSVAFVLSITAASRLVWLSPAIPSRICRFPTYLNQDYIMGMYVLVHAIPIGTVVLLYGFILRASLRHVRKIHAQELAVASSRHINGDLSNIEEETSSTTNRRKKRHRDNIKHRKAAKTVSIIVGIFIVLVVPIIAIDLAEMLGAPSVPATLTRLCVFMIYANNCINVLVYAGFNQDFRRAFKKIIVKFFRSFLGIRPHRWSKV